MNDRLRAESRNHRLTTGNTWMTSSAPLRGYRPISAADDVIADQSGRPFSLFLLPALFAPFSDGDDVISTLRGYRPISAADDVIADQSGRPFSLFLRGYS